MPKASDIPTIVYDYLRAIHESRMRRLHTGEDIAIPHLSNSAIFALMPDCTNLDWRKGRQEAILTRTLSAMHTSFTQGAI